jgi:hypothetical protein
VVADSHHTPPIAGSNGSNAATDATFKREESGFSVQIGQTAASAPADT